MPTAEKEDEMKALCFGEVLWDVFGDDRKLGGAPLNVAGHITRLGGSAEIVSAVGDDDLGRSTLSYIDRIGVGRKYMKTVAAETGKAIVTLKDGIPSYRFTDPSAWDEIALTESEKEEIRNTHYDVFVFGSLAQRKKESHETLLWLLDNVDADNIFFDVNLRLDFYTKDIIEHGIEKADILKMNDEEVPVIAGLLGIGNDENAIPGIKDKYGLKMVLLTCGKQGTYLYTDKGVIHQDIRKVKVVDTVGAGDSLSSGFLYFLSKGEELVDVVRKASYLADYVVQNQGAIPEYDEYLRKELGLD